MKIGYQLMDELREKQRLEEIRLGRKLNLYELLLLLEVPDNGSDKIDKEYIEYLLAYHAIVSLYLYNNKEK